MIDRERVGVNQWLALNVILFDVRDKVPLDDIVTELGSMLRASFVEESVQRLAEQKCVEVIAAFGGTLPRAQILVRVTDRGEGMRLEKRKVNTVQRREFISRLARRAKRRHAAPERKVT